MVLREHLATYRFVNVSETNSVYESTSYAEEHVSPSCTHENENIDLLKEEIESLKEEVSRLRNNPEVNLLEEEIQKLKAEKEEVSRSCTIEIEFLQERVKSLEQAASRQCIEDVEVDLLKEEIKKLEAENKCLKSRHLVFETIVKDNDLCYHYTGLPRKVVSLLRDLLQKIRENHTINSVKVLSISDQLLLTLVRLRRNLSYVDLAFRFGISVSSVQTVFTTTLEVLHEVLFRDFMNIIPSCEKNEMFIPECFKSYPNVRIVLDCTEIPCEIPKNMEKQKATYSNYKGRNTLKFLIGCSINGCITYCSPAFPGSTSDQAIVEHTGILSQMDPGNVVVADKGFIIAHLLPSGVSLNIPPFLDTPEFSETNIFECRSKARARIHIERINSRLKRFLICSRIPHKLFSSCDQIVQTCCALVNLQNPVQGECTEFFKNIGKQ